MVKTLWRGAFNYQRSMEPIIYRYAYTERQAWKVMCDEIARRNNVPEAYVYGLFDGSKPNFEITIEKEVRKNGV